MSVFENHERQTNGHVAPNVWNFFQTFDTQFAYEAKQIQKKQKEEKIKMVQQENRNI